jgi:hypothetical protein
MDAMVSLILAALLGAFLSSVAFALIARGLGFNTPAALKPEYCSVSRFMARDNSVVAPARQAKAVETQPVYYSYDPSSSLYYPILSKGDPAGVTKIHHPLKPNVYAAVRKNYPVPVNEPLKEDSLDEKDGGTFSGSVTNINNK